MTGQQHQPLLFFVAAPAVFVFIFCTRHGILYDCAIIYRVPRRLERALWLLTYWEWSTSLFWTRINDRRHTNCLRWVSERIVLHHSLYTFLSSWQHPRKSLFRTTRRCMERERAEGSIATGFREFCVVSGTVWIYVASWWPCRWYPKVPTALLKTLGQNVVKKNQICDQNHIFAQIISRVYPIQLETAVIIRFISVCAGPIFYVNTPFLITNGPGPWQAA